MQTMFKMNLTEDKVKTIIYIILTIIFSICLICFSGEMQKNTEVLAASGNNASNLQLMARAINGEARGESYEGQVAVRSSNNEQSKT